MRIAVLGLGAMGSRMAQRLVEANHQVIVWNRTREACLPLAEAGAELADSPRAAVAGVDLALGMVRDDGSSREIWTGEEGALAAMSPGTLVVDCATLTPAWVRQLAGHCKTHGLRFLDAPVAGSRPQAEAGQLIFLVGGEEQDLAEAHPVLATMGGTIHHAGPTGAGAVLKLAVNASLAIQAATMAELLGFLGRSGLELQKALSLLVEVPVISPAAKALAEAMIQGRYEPLFPIELVRKDLHFLLASGQKVAAKTPLARCAHEVFRDAESEGLQALNITAVAKGYL